MELTAEALPAAAILDGSPSVQDGEIARSSLPGSGDLVTGIWSCTPGKLTDVEADETFVVLAGRATIEAAGCAAVEVGPGDVCVLSAGTATTWTVHETLRKVYVIHDAG